MAEMTGPRLGRRLLLGGAASLLGAADQAPAERGSAERMPLAAVPLSRMNTPWWAARHRNKVEELRSRRVDLVWLGDSITQDFEKQGPPDWQDFAPVWHRYYGDRHALNLGFRGDNTAHLLWRMQNGELDGIAPRAAVVLIGANNLGRVRWSAQQTVAGIVAVVDELRRRQPRAGIVLIGMLPSIRSKWVTRTTNAVNRELAERYAPGHAVAFRDVSALFLRDGQVDRTKFYDDHLDPPDPPLHPTAQAMARVVAAIEPAVAAALGDRPKVV